MFKAGIASASAANAVAVCIETSSAPAEVTLDGQTGRAQCAKP
jgi:hypothetical protein